MISPLYIHSNSHSDASLYIQFNFDIAHKLFTLLCLPLINQLKVKVDQLINQMVVAGIVDQSICDTPFLL